MDFVCSQCTACCKLAGEMGIMPRRKDGACKYLTKDNQCSIYETRPLECNVKKMANHFGKKEKDYYKTVSKTCNSLMEYYKIDKKYRLDPNIYSKEK